MKDVPDLKSIPLIEKSRLFATEDAFAISVSKKSLRNYSGSKEPKIEGILSFQKIIFESAINRTELKYGDFVKIITKNKHIKKDGVLYTDCNHKGFFPNVMFMALGKEFRIGKMSLECVFQIVPDNLELWGRAIAYGGSSEKKLNIRHFLSGGFLYS